MRRIALFSLLLIALTACQPAKTNPGGSSAPMLTVREATNCRTGPGTDYVIAFTYPPGAKLEIVGRDEPENFWLVKSDKSSTGTCWMWGGSVDVTGNTQTVPGVLPSSAPTSISTSAPDGAPSGTLFVDKWEYSCNSGTLTFTMNWTDRATNEAGYRIFRDGGQLVELPANSTSYTDTFAVSAGQSVEYYLQVFGPDGSTNSSVMKAGC